MKMSAVEAASQFVAAYFPDCEASLLAGSNVQGGATDTSDLDVVIFDETGPGPYRKTFVAFGWVIEAFILTRSSYRFFFDQGIDSAIPSLQRMCAEGIFLRGDNSISDIVEEAREELTAGPPAWSVQDLNKARYEIGESLQDLEGCGHRAECLFIVRKLSGQLAEFMLRTGGQWIGDGKWLWRCLKQYDAAGSAELSEALEAYYRYDSKKPLLAFAYRLLESYGGLLTEGYSEGLWDEGEAEENSEEEGQTFLIHLLESEKPLPD